MTKSLALPLLEDMPLEPTPAPPHWSVKTAKWFIRVMTILVTLVVVPVIFMGAPANANWESMMDPPLTPKEAAIARIGVLFQHAYMWALFIMLLLCVELGSVVMIQAALFGSALAFILNGPYGKTFFDPLCNDFNTCIQMPPGYATIFGGFAGVAILQLGLICYFVTGLKPYEAVSATQ
jgi:hypothetical protein